MAALTRLGDMMSQVELLTGGVTTRDKAYLGGLCALSTLAAVLTIDYASPAILDFRWDDAAAELGWTITTLLRKIVFSTVCCPNKLRQDQIGMHGPQNSKHVCTTLNSNARNMVACQRIILQGRPAAVDRISVVWVQRVVCRTSGSQRFSRSQDARHGIRRGQRIQSRHEPAGSAAYTSVSGCHQGHCWGLSRLHCGDASARHCPAYTQPNAHAPPPPGNAAIPETQHICHGAHAAQCGPATDWRTALGESS